MTVTLPAVLPTPKATGSTTTATADASDSPSFAQVMQASTQAHGVQPGGRHTVAKSVSHAKLPTTDPARKLADQIDHSDEPTIEGASLPAGAELAAQALMWAQHTLAQRQASASPSVADAAQNGASRPAHATGKEIALRLRVTDAATLDRGSRSEQHDDHGAEAGAGRFVLNTQALSVFSASADADSPPSKPAGAAVSKTEVATTADSAAHSSDRERVMLPSPMQQALLALSETGAREAADATLGENGASRPAHATGKEIALRLRVTDAATLDRGSRSEQHDDHGAEAGAGRFVLNTQALSVFSASADADSPPSKPAGAAVSKTEVATTADSAAHSSDRERVMLPSPMQQALLALSETGAREAADATLGDTAWVGTSADLALAHDSVATPHEQMPVFHQILREVATDTVPRATLPVPVHHAQWGQAVSEQVVAWTKDMQSGDLKAELRLDPPDLGPLRIALTIADGVTSASFASAHASVRHALEQALPQLQAALADAGLSLGNAHVGDQNVHDQHQQAASRSGKGRDQNAEATDDGLEGSAPVIARTGVGLVDVFA